MNCKFAPYCRYFDEEAVVCKSEEKACDYCGTYAEFDLIIELKKRNSIPEITP